MNNRRQIELLKKYKDETDIDEDNKEELEELKGLELRRLIGFGLTAGKRRTAQTTKEGQEKIGLYR